MKHGMKMHVIAVETDILKAVQVQENVYSVETDISGSLKTNV